MVSKKYKLYVILDMIFILLDHFYKLLLTDNQ